MGMIGNYIAVENSLLEQILNGDKAILEIEANQDQTLDIDKSWQALHYLLCKNIDNGEPPMSYVVPLLDDNVIDSEQDFGAFYITPEQVKTASNFLNMLNDDTIKRMYNFQEMQQQELYPLVEDDDENEFYEYIFSYLTELKWYFMQVAKQGDAIVFYIL